LRAGGCGEFGKIGAGVKIKDVEEEGAGQFITDHLGLMADLAVEQA
jgi:hypothetical protein